MIIAIQSAIASMIWLLRKYYNSSSRLICSE